VLDPIPSPALNLLVALGFALAFGRDAWASGDDAAAATPGWPFHFGKALEFAAIIGAGLVAASLLGRWLGDAGVLVAGALAGLADSQAAAWLAWLAMHG